MAAKRRPKIVQTLAEAGRHFSRTAGTIGRWVREDGCPGRAGHYDLDAIEAWLDARNSDADPEMTGAVSPALERFRNARADLAELERDQKRKELVPRHEVHQVMGQVADVLRNAGTVLGKRWGAEARRVLDKAIDDAQRLVRQLEIREEG